MDLIDLIVNIIYNINYLQILQIELNTVSLKAGRMKP